MWFKKDYTADYSLCDYTGNLSVRSIAEIIESSVAANFGLMGCDNATLRAKYDAMWVFVKNNIHFLSEVKWNDSFHVEAYCISYKKLKCIVETDFLNDAGEVFAYSILECCVLDVHSHALRKLDTIPFPMDYVCREGKESFFSGKQNVEFSFLESVVVRSQDVDFSKHLNNVSYIRYILNTYSVQQLLDRRIKSMEIYYIREVTENTKLDILKYSMGDKDIFSIKNGDTEVFSIHIGFED